MQPNAADLIAAVKADGPGALDRWMPWIDELTDIDGAARFLGIQARSISRARLRIRADKTPEFPNPDRIFGRSPAWRFRTLVLARAASPGRGGSGRWQPGQSGRRRAS